MTFLVLIKLSIGIYKGEIMKEFKDINKTNVIDFINSKDFDEMVKFANWQLIEPIRKALKDFNKKPSKPKK